MSMHNPPFRWLMLATFSVLGAAWPMRAASPVATYQFQGGFTAEETGAPAIVPVDLQGASAFVSDAVLGQTRTVWAFNGAGSPVDQQAGLTVRTAGLIPPHAYSVDFVAKLNDREGAYRRLIDVQNRQSDNGFYVAPSDDLDVYPASGTSAAWSNGVYHHVVVTTDGTTVNAYLDGVSQFTSTTNLLNLDVDPADNPNALMGFFLDNVAGGGQGEWSSGSVALIRLWDGVLTPTEAQALASNPFASTTVSVEVTSPPAGVALVSGDAVSAAAEVEDAEGDVTAVQFYLDGVLLGSVPAPGPYVFAFTAPAAGAHTVSVIAIKNDGTNATQTSAFTSVNANPATPAPSVDFLTDADGRKLAAGTTFTLSAAAFSNLAGDQLARVDFYADGAVFASFDGTGAVLSADDRPTRKDALADGSAFSAPFKLPGVNKLVNLVAVALTKAGLAHVSKPVTVQSVANVADRAPAVRITGLAQGARVIAGAASTEVPVEISDPDAAPTASVKSRPIRRAFDASPLIARVEYYLNAIKVKDSAQAPYTLPLAAEAPGTYVLTAIATDGAGLATISDPVKVEAVAPATVTIAVKGTSLLTEGGGKGKAIITRAGDASSDLTVYFKAKGSAVNGVDYQALPASITIPAGATTVKVKIKPIAGSPNSGARSIKVQLLPAPASEYSLGAGIKAKFTLSDGD